MMLDCGNRQVDCCSFCHISKKYRYGNIHISKQEERELLSCSPSNVFRSSFVISLVEATMVPPAPLQKSFINSPLSFPVPQNKVLMKLIFFGKACVQNMNLLVNVCERYGMENNSTCCRSSQTRPSHRRALQASEPWSASTRSAACTSWGQAWKTCV